MRKSICCLGAITILVMVGCDRKAPQPITPAFVIDWGARHANHCLSVSTLPEPYTDVVHSPFDKSIDNQMYSGIRIEGKLKRDEAVRVIVEALYRSADEQQSILDVHIHTEVLSELRVVNAAEVQIARADCIATLSNPAELEPGDYHFIVHAK